MIYFFLIFFLNFLITKLNFDLLIVNLKRYFFNKLVENNKLYFLIIMNNSLTLNNNGNIKVLIKLNLFL